MIRARRKLIVLCDLDGMVADLMTPWLSAYNRDYSDNLTQAQLLEFDIHHFVKPECGQKIYDYINAGDVYAQLQPIPGALLAIEAIKKQGHEVVIVTAGAKHEHTAGHKLEWCKRYLGFSRKDCMIAHRKELVRGDVFLDDSPKMIRNYRKAWPNTPILSIAYPHNECVAPICTRYPDFTDTFTAWQGIVDGIDQISVPSYLAPTA